MPAAIREICAFRRHCSASPTGAGAITLDFFSLALLAAYVNDLALPSRSDTIAYRALATY